MRRERTAIEKQNNAALKFKKQLDEQAAIMNDIDKTSAERRKAKESHANFSIRYEAEKAKLDELLNPRDEDDELVETFAPVNEEVKDALARLDNQIADAPENSKAREELERKRRELQNQNDKVAKLQSEKSDLRTLLSRKKVGSKGYKKAQDALDNKSKVLATAQKKLTNLVEATKPPQVEEEPDYAPPINDKVAKAIADLKQEIAETDGKDADELEDRLFEIQSKNEEVSRMREKIAALESAKRKAIASKDYNGYEESKNKVDWYKSRLGKAEKELDDLAEPPKSEVNETPKEITIEDKQALAEIAKLDSEIDALRNESEEVNEAEISTKKKRRDKIHDTAQRIAELKAQIEAGGTSLQKLPRKT